MSKAPNPTAEAPTIRAHINGEWRAAEQYQEVRDPYRGDIVAYAPVSTAQDCSDAVAAAHAARHEMAAMPGHERAALLRRAADQVLARSEDIAHAMARESGKALRDCLAEAQRSAETLRLCAEEAVRIQGEHVPMDVSPTGAGKIAMTLRFPVGVVAAITPFNGPVHLATHKVGPALAAGNTVVLKPSPKTPLCIHKYVEAFIEAGVPRGALNVVYGDAIAPQLVTDPRVDFVSFTGSIPVGKIIRGSVGMKRVALELGGVGPTFVHGDADLAAAAKACARNAMALAGQSCVSVQNVYVQNRVYEPFVEAVCREIDTIRFGDPMDLATEVGTLIDEQAAIRVESMIHRAAEAGATLLRGGKRQGAQLDATVLTHVSADMGIVRDEVFGPAMSIQPYEALDPIFAAISESPYGLQCGIYTNSLDRALSAFRKVRTGGVIVNGTSRWRSDQMPYGGVKDSGIGREGPKFAIRDMTEERLLVLN
ncbi:aldehyde dehydrogenase family protein [Cupriavidus alkaliphilus]|uniref:aldehyde dehydrogenase family protein n=1 Tax=Cupriavidus alkaliphilus TaxID=942866 RepID=UPI00160C84EC|nr:aldehyde dehydrogenase family protein [Cupriavidus alkaliphilus]MBB3014064.1 acyl-CoA reductase-like NAD-dependent aldehyde dehydrogenase [Cupriavidus alkaliphilus]